MHIEISKMPPGSSVSFLDTPKKKYDKDKAKYEAVNRQDEEEDFEFNQDFEIEDGTRSPGWIRYQKRIK